MPMFSVVLLKLYSLNQRLPSDLAGLYVLKPKSPLKTKNQSHISIQNLNQQLCL